MPEPTPTGQRPRDPLRRIALISLAIAVPVLVALVVLTNVLGGPDGSGDRSGAAADVQGTPTPPARDQLPVVEVQTPPVTPEANADCPALMSRLPLQLAGEPSRRVQSASPFAYAWGDPAIVLVCGVDRPSGFSVGAGLIQINDVQWFVDTSDPHTVVWTAVDRPVYVQVRVPSSTDSASVTELTAQISAALPYRAPQPAP